MLKAKPVWFSLDVFKVDPGGYNAAHASVARALERAFTGRAVTGEYTEPRPMRYTKVRSYRGCSDTSTNTRLIESRLCCFKYAKIEKENNFKTLVSGRSKRLFLE